MSGEQKKQREILIENKSREEKDPAYQEQRVEWNVTLEDPLMAERRLKNPSKRLSGQAMRRKKGKTIKSLLPKKSANAGSIRQTRGRAAGDRVDSFDELVSSKVV